jgi:hypothetical protein
MATSVKGKTNKSSLGSILARLVPVVSLFALAVAPAAYAQSQETASQGKPAFIFLAGQRVWVHALTVAKDSPENALITVDDSYSWDAAVKDFKRKKVFEYVPRAKDHDFVYLTVCTGKNCKDRLSLAVLPGDYEQYMTEIKVKEKVGLLGRLNVKGFQINLTALVAGALWTSDAKLNNAKRMGISMATMNILNVRNNSARNIVDQFHSEVMGAAGNASGPGQAQHVVMPLPPGQTVTLRATGLSILVPANAANWSARLYQGEFTGDPAADELNWPGEGHPDLPHYISVRPETGTCEALQKAALENPELKPIESVEHAPYLPDSLPSPVLRRRGAIQACLPASGGTLRITFLEPGLFLQEGTPDFQRLADGMKAMLDAVAKAADKKQATAAAASPQH